MYQSARSDGKDVAGTVWNACCSSLLQLIPELLAASHVLSPVTDYQLLL